MNAQRMMALMSAIVLALGLSATSAQAANGTAKWDELIQVLQQDTQGVESPDYGGMLRDSQVSLNLANGYVRFVVTGWPMSTESAAPSHIKGTLVCNASTGAQATLVDTPSVPLSETGQASFGGQLEIPASCVGASDDLAFFVRTAVTAAP